MPDLASTKWVWWLILYGTIAIGVPWALVNAWARRHGKSLQSNVSQVFGCGELGLIGLVLAASVIWDLQRCAFAFVTVTLGSALMALAGIMSANVWVEDYCRRLTGTRNNPARSWRDARDLGLLVFSIAMVVEMLLDRLSKVLTL